MAEIGNITLILALMASIYSAVAFLIGAKGRHPALLRSARNGLIAVCGLLSLAVLILLYALITHNFQIEYVAQYTSTDLPLAYRISALWAGNDGSLLFWAWLLSLFSVIAVLQKKDTAKALVPYAAFVMLVAEVFFLLLIMATSNPFETLVVGTIPPDGWGLNPLLENPGMIIHPPLLLAGYIGFTIPFAFAIAALISGRLSNEWITVIRRWTIISWLFLGVGNLIGAWWAYVELGWGGYWAWDPVENAGLLPWLIATAFLHSIMMQRRKGMFKIWNMSLVILTFSLAIFGTFLTRGDILSSIHTFNDSSMNIFFLTFLIITIIGSFGLLYYRREELKSEGETEFLISRESTFVLNNVLLVGSALVILLGTMFPVISETFTGAEVTVGESFFNQVNGPIFLAIILLTGLCTVIGWRRASGRILIRNLSWPIVATVLVGIVLFFIGVKSLYALAAFIISSLVLFSILYQWFRETRARRRLKGDNYIKAFFNLLRINNARYGGYIIHISIVLIAIGIIGSSFYGTEVEAALRKGESISINNYTLTYEDINRYESKSKTTQSVTLSVYNNGQFIGKLTPEKYYHRNYEQPVTEVAIRSTLLEDLYVIFINSDSNDNAGFKVLVNPLVGWIWFGGGIFTLGGLVAFWPSRKKVLTEDKTETLEFDYYAGTLTEENYNALKASDKEKPDTVQINDDNPESDTTIDLEIEKEVLKLRKNKFRFCPQCGAKCQEEDLFCSGCGTGLSEGGDID